MNDHTTTIVPYESWIFHSPHAFEIGNKFNIGLLSEALIYYDKVYLLIKQPNDLYDFFNWFKKRGILKQVNNLINHGELMIYEQSFFTTGMYDPNTNLYHIYNINDDDQKKPDSFAERYFENKEFDKIFQNKNERKRVKDNILKNLIEVKASQFEDAIENARKDYSNPRRSELILQTLVNDLYTLRNLKDPPQIKVKQNIVNGNTRTTYNLNFNELKNIAGSKLKFDAVHLYTASAHSNTLIKAASLANADLFLGSPMSSLVGDKLYESSKTIIKEKEIIENLMVKVEFPDIQKLINTKKISFEDILVIRKKARKFRTWLQEEAEKDRDAIVAYHHEVSNTTSLKKYGRKILRIFGYFGPPSLGVITAEKTKEPYFGVAVGAYSQLFLDSMSAKLEVDWKPIVFGQWYKDEIEAMLKKNSTKK